MIHQYVGNNGMKDIENIFFNEEWDKVLQELNKDKSLISNIDPANLAWKRFQYQLAENGVEELVPPFGKLSDLLKVINLCKKEGLLGSTIPQATALQQPERIKYLISQGQKLDEQDFGERTGLLVASALNDLKLVKFFIDQDAFVSFFDQENLEAIDITTSKEIKDLLQSHNGKTEKQREKEYNEYCDAIEHLNNLREINLSFMKGAEKGDIEQMGKALKNSSMAFMTLNFAYPINGWTSLHYAVKNNDRKAIDFLIANGIDQTKKNLDGLTAIELAKEMGNREIYENE
jgi:hypothetical protein